MNKWPWVTFPEDSSTWECCKKEHEETLRQHNIMREALEFYADKDKWALLEDSSNMRSEIIAKDLQEFRPNKRAEYCGGKRARQALAQIRGEK